MPAIRALEAFRAALHDLLRDLALQVVKDGEGISKFVTIDDRRRRERRRGAAHRLRDRQLAAGQDGHRRRGRQLGPRRDGRRQGRARRPTATGSRSAFGGITSPATASAPPSYDETTVARLHEGPRDRRSRVDVGVGAGRGHRVDLRPHPRLHLDQRRLPQLGPDREIRLNLAARTRCGGLLDHHTSPAPPSPCSVCPSLTSTTVNTASCGAVNRSALVWGHAWARDCFLSRPAR